MDSTQGETSTILTQAELSRASGASRQSINISIKRGKLIKKEDGTIDISIPENAHWIETHRVKTGTEKPIEELAAAINANKPKKEKKIKNDKPTAENETDQINEEKQQESDNKTGPKEIKGESLPARKMRLEIEKLEEQRDKLKIENQKARAELVEREMLADMLFGYLIALNKNILSMPLSYIDEFDSGVKTKKSKTELTDILRKPISQAIQDTKEQIKKEIERYKRSVKYKNTNQSDTEE